jgi:hypothetical protein
MELGHDQASGGRTLSDADVDAIARRVVDLLHERRLGDDRSLVSPQALGAILGVTAAWVRYHARDLGGVQLGDGPKARWRFDPVEARERLNATREEPPLRAPRTLRADARFPPVDGPRRTSRTDGRFPPVQPRRPRRKKT